MHCIPTCLPTCLPACLPIYLPSYLPTCLPTYLPTPSPSPLFAPDKTDKLINWTTYTTIKAYGLICYYNAHEAHINGKSTTCMYCIDQFNMGAQW